MVLAIAALGETSRERLMWIPGEFADPGGTATALCDYGAFDPSAAMAGAGSSHNHLSTMGGCL
ncbi:hypothetical protein SBRY_40034 [Actinacidiphila bryophytorum]|uniref:Uncharacterized protein n=1 Tax=Actinacidiphila bryophytorum TaxID=1436133 RepID=A0A9W4H290_9ACTN|nr:hypothetical protein SBRY_40034 [Actinacidiphila bryophytorum]